MITRIAIFIHDSSTEISLSIPLSRLTDRNQLIPPSLAPTSRSRAKATLGRRRNAQIHPFWVLVAAPAQRNRRCHICAPAPPPFECAASLACGSGRDVTPRASRSAERHTRREQSIGRDMRWGMSEQSIDRAVRSEIKVRGGGSNKECMHPSTRIQRRERVLQVDASGHLRAPRVEFTGSARMWQGSAWDLSRGLTHGGGR